MHPSLHARLTADKAAYRMAGSGEVVTYGALDAASNRVAQLLRAKGLVPGDHIAILLEKHRCFFELCWGAQRSGIIYTAISSRLTPGEAAFIIADSGAKLLVSSKALQGLAGALVSQTPGVATRLMVGGTIEGYDSYEDAIAKHPARPIVDQTAGRDILYSCLCRISSRRHQSDRILNKSRIHEAPAALSLQSA